MKKILIVSSVVLAVLAVAFAGFIGYASAQTPNPDGTLCPTGSCDGQALGMGGGRMMGARGASADTQGMGPGMMNRRGGQGTSQGGGLLQPYMVSAFAEALDMTPEALQAELDGGKTVYEIATAKGYTDEQFLELKTTVRTTALEEAVAAGVITQEQADWMLQRWQTRQAGGFAAGSCPRLTTP